MRCRLLVISLLVVVLTPLSLCAQKLTFSQPHGFCDAPFSLTITGDALPEDAASAGKKKAPANYQGKH